MMAIEELLETEVAMLAADRACELAENRLADLEALLEQMRADRDYWRDQARCLRKCTSTATTGESRHDLSSRGGSE